MLGRDGEASWGALLRGHLWRAGPLPMIDLWLFNGATFYRARSFFDGLSNQLQKRLTFCLRVTKVGDCMNLRETPSATYKCPTASDLQCIDSRRDIAATPCVHTIVAQRNSVRARDGGSFSPLSIRTVAS